MRTLFIGKHALSCLSAIIIAATLVGCGADSNNTSSDPDAVAVIDLASDTPAGIWQIEYVENYQTPSETYQENIREYVLMTERSDGDYKFHSCYHVMAGIYTLNDDRSLTRTNTSSNTYIINPMTAAHQNFSGQYFSGYDGSYSQTITKIKANKVSNSLSFIEAEDLDYSLNLTINEEAIDANIACFKIRNYTDYNNDDGQLSIEEKETAYFRLTQAEFDTGYDQIEASIKRTFTLGSLTELSSEIQNAYIKVTGILKTDEENGNSADIDCLADDTNCADTLSLESNSQKLAAKFKFISRNESDIAVSISVAKK